MTPQVGNEFSSVEALWSQFENVMAKDEEGKDAAGADEEQEQELDHEHEHEHEQQDDGDRSTTPKGEPRAL